MDVPYRTERCFPKAGFSFREALGPSQPLILQSVSPDNFSDTGILIVMNPFDSIVRTDFPHVFRQYLRLKMKRKSFVCIIGDIDD